MDHQEMWVDSHFTIWAKGGVESTHRKYIFLYNKWKYMEIYKGRGLKGQQQVLLEAIGPTPRMQ